MTVHFDDNEATNVGTLPATDQVRLGTHQHARLFYGMVWYVVVSYGVVC